MDGMELLTPEIEVTLLRNSLSKYAYSKVPQDIELEWKALDKHVHSKMPQDIELANLLIIRRALRSDSTPLEQLSRTQRELRRIYEEKVAKLETAIDEALTKPDHAFLRNLARAAERVEAYDRGDKTVLRQSCSLPGLVVFAFIGLRMKLGRTPSWLEVRRRIEMWQREGGVDGAEPKSERWWQRVREDSFIAALFRKR
jgi:hypothetical protein